MLTTNKQHRHVDGNNMAVDVNLQGGGVGGLNKPPPLLPFFLNPNQITSSWLVSCVKATNKGESGSCLVDLVGKDEKKIVFSSLEPFL